MAHYSHKLPRFRVRFRLLERGWHFCSEQNKNKLKTWHNLRAAFKDPLAPRVMPAGHSREMPRRAGGKLSASQGHGAKAGVGSLYPLVGLGGQGAPVGAPVGAPDGGEWGEFGVGGGGEATSQPEVAAYGVERWQEQAAGTGEAQRQVFTLAWP